MIEKTASRNSRIDVSIDKRLVASWPLPTRCGHLRYARSTSAAARTCHDL